ncbi:MAG: hypothetical protein OPY07_04925 [Nitrosopumilus sp.]|nr:hypothetical protein [Nitrosopumilus sp.]
MTESTFTTSQSILLTNCCTVVPILSSMFPLREQKGGPMDNKTFFEESEINVQKAMFASKLLQFSGDYLLQAFPEQEYPNLHLRIKELVDNLKGMTESFNRNQKLQKQLKRLEDHVQYFEPLPLSPNPTQYNAACLYCHGLGTSKTEEEAIKKIQHATKCTVPKEGDDNYSYKSEKWYKIQHPSKLVITWDQRKLLDELKIKTRKK